MESLEGQMVFLNSNLEKVEKMLNEIKRILDDPTICIKKESTYVMLTILKEVCKSEEKLELYFIPDESREKLIADKKQAIANFIAEEKDNILKFFEMLEVKNKKTYLRLKNFEWKFIGLSSIDGFEKGIIQPKILVKLTFNDDSTKIFESDYANIKKFQEEIEECVSGFNSTYTRRIEFFAK